MPGAIHTGRQQSCGNRGGKAVMFALRRLLGVPGADYGAVLHIQAFPEARLFFSAVLPLDL